MTLRLTGFATTSLTPAQPNTFDALTTANRFHRSRSNRRVAGVCAGIADYLEVSSFSVRLVTLLSFFFLGPFTFWAYIICWFVIDPEPCSENYDAVLIPACSAQRSRRPSKRREKRRAAARQRHADRHYARNVRKGYMNSEEQAAHDEHADQETAADFAAERANADSFQSRQQCTQLYSELEQRLRDIEAFMTSKRFRLHCEINRI